MLPIPGSPAPTAAGGKSLTLVTQDKVTAHTTWSFALVGNSASDMALRPSDNWDLNL